MGKFLSAPEDDKVVKKKKRKRFLAICLWKPRWEFDINLRVDCRNSSVCTCSM
jgi:hypothetical protein